MVDRGLGWVYIAVCAYDPSEITAALYQDPHHPIPDSAANTFMDPSTHNQDTIDQYGDVTKLHDLREYMCFECERECCATRGMKYEKHPPLSTH